ncbi:hypothetical protein HHK36_017904 [Tetracentron sinense]|uniref:Nodulin homeobox N-terminal domain-containing protein n=1 Tax=Tetracentron sinense TaxID=13715 RepID=A0A835DDI1_TETSI|nr:hypothetical protein HHK36_017904 [Tetracentron sinense]
MMSALPLQHSSNHTFSNNRSTCDLSFSLSLCSLRNQRGSSVQAPKKGKAPPPSSMPAKSGRGKQKKKKWSKGKQKEKVNYMVLFDQASYDKLSSEVPKYKLITPFILSDRLREKDVTSFVPPLHSALVACSLHLLTGYISSEWQDLVHILLAHPKVPFAKLLSRRIAIHMFLQTKLSPQNTDVLCKKSLPPAAEQTEVCREGGVLSLARAVLKLDIAPPYNEISTVVAAVSRLKSKVLSILKFSFVQLLQLCEAESLSSLDEIASDGFAAAERVRVGAAHQGLLRDKQGKDCRRTWWKNQIDGGIIDRFNKRSPDFKPKDTCEGLWLDRSPAWVLPKLPPATKPKQDGAVGKRDTFLSYDFQEANTFTKRKERKKIGAGREVLISLDWVRDKNLMQLKKLNTDLFLVCYNDKYYADTLVSGEFTKLGFPYLGERIENFWAESGPFELQRQKKRKMSMDSNSKDRRRGKWAWMGSL